jgi:hypothetical protein
MSIQAFSSPIHPPFPFGEPTPPNTRGEAIQDDPTSSSLLNTACLIGLPLRSLYEVGDVGL